MDGTAMARVRLGPAREARAGIGRCGMKGGPSRTAWGVARLRALHQLRDGGAIFPDPFAIALLGEDVAALHARPETPDSRRVRRFIAARSRIGEAFLAHAVERGVRQAVMLGAGFDTFALRNPYPDLQVFEIDHPATQAHKRARLTAAGLAIPDRLRLVPVDFERDSLMEALSAAGFAAAAPCFFLWLGVIVYLTPEAIDATLRLIAGLDDAELVFDYTEPPENFPEAARAFVAERRRRVAAIGEPWVSHFRREEMAARLQAHGFAHSEDLDGAAIEDWIAAHTPGMDGRRIAGSHLVRARVRR
ncbi:methyltransferase (TIGR00027 family) [Ancylobacter sp. 3268]|uniref:class I SAM-dependent methyltransferase n=1 Tax=Ancylobacter sp. 3268 TaxID=2817752 RepID=UPI00285C0FF8|nr:SAM-dependent methyltransferase [Ancylobacter sp. 3268]MDR6952009.1 methyltransferase (TIGR00027 family) [Ancylobacter sp. 3268]